MNTLKIEVCYLGFEGAEVLEETLECKPDNFIDAIDGWLKRTHENAKKLEWKWDMEHGEGVLTPHILNVENADPETYKRIMRFGEFNITDRPEQLGLE